MEIKTNTESIESGNYCVCGTNEMNAASKAHWHMHGNSLGSQPEGCVECSRKTLAQKEKHWVMLCVTARQSG